MVKSWLGKKGNMSDIFIAHTKLFGLLNVCIQVSIHVCRVNFKVSETMASSFYFFHNMYFVFG